MSVITYGLFVYMCSLSYFYKISETSNCVHGIAANAITKQYDDKTGTQT